MIGRKCQKELGGGCYRRRRFGFRGRLVFGVVLGLVGVVGVPLGVSAVQNIFTGFGQITDIQFQGEDIDQVVYRGTVLWEREPEMTGVDIQTITSANCPAERTRVRDARDDATYWVQKMADGRCWMLTNLAYGGGGDNVYGDVKSITNSETLDYAQPFYMIPAGSNRTTGTTDPSTSTNGTEQYGYLYNWCAAMGAQAGTDACRDTDTTDANTSISVCPSGWRLPVGDSGGEFQQLTDAIGATTNGNSGGTTGSTNLRTTWLAMYSGNWYGSFINQGSLGVYWSSTQNPSYSYYAYSLNFPSSNVYPSHYSNEQNGFAVRCVAV